MKHWWLPGSSRTLAIAIATCAVAETARADLNVCNCSGVDVIFETTKRATHCSTSDPWDATGWFFIPHKTCSTVITGNMTGQTFHWTAASASITWGSSSSAESWLVPNFAHNNMCNAFIPPSCSNAGASCRTSPHWAVSSSTKDFEIDVDPNNTFDTNRSFNCGHGRNDCVAFRCQ